MQEIEVKISKKDFKTWEDFIQIMSNEITMAVKAKGHSIELQPPDGDNTTIKILHPLGSEWGDEEIRVSVEYFSFTH